MEAFLDFGWLCLTIAYGAIVWLVPYLLILSLPPLILAAGFVVAYATRDLLPWAFIFESLRWVAILALLYVVYWCLSTLPPFPF